MYKRIKVKRILLFLVTIMLAGGMIPEISAFAQKSEEDTVYLEEGLVRDTEAVELFNEWSASTEIQEKKKIVSILGDSLSTFRGFNPDDRYYEYYEDGHMSVEQCWWMRYIQSLDMQLGINESLGGSKISWRPQDEVDFKIAPSECMASVERIDRLDDRGTPDVILFFGGFNDVGYSELGVFVPGEGIGDVTTFCNAYQTALVRMRERYPKAEIICMTPYLVDAYQSNDNAKNDAAVNAYADAILEICSYYTIKCVDLRKAGIDKVQDVCAPDYMHVNENGHYKIWYMLENGKARPKAVKGMCWLYQDTSIDVGLAYSEKYKNALFSWRCYDLAKKKWSLLSDWKESNWYSWKPKKGNYWLYAQIKTEDGVTESKTVGFRIDRNYPIYIDGKYQGPDPGGAGWLMGISVNANPEQKYRFEMLVLDCTKYINGDPNPWIYGTGLNTVKKGKTFWTTYRPSHKGYYWTYFRIYDEKGSLIEDQCYGAVF